MILVIDNYDSFTFNLVHHLSELGQDVVVARNDEATPEQIYMIRPDGIVISPGPCTPKEAGVSVEVIRRLGSHVPILGVCLGHQCIGEAYGGRIIRAPQLMHGKSSLVYHDGRGVFTGLPQPFEAIRYHSLVVQRPDLPQVLEVAAETAEGLIMGIRHRRFPVHGVQFHPESVMTPVGKDLLERFVDICGLHAADARAEPAPSAVAE